MSQTHWYNVFCGYLILINFGVENYSSGRRGAPAKGVGRVTGARVQIPPSPPNSPEALVFAGFSGLFIAYRHRN